MRVGSVTASRRLVDEGYSELVERLRDLCERMGGKLVSTGRSYRCRIRLRDGSRTTIVLLRIDSGVEDYG